MKRLTLLWLLLLLSIGLQLRASTPSKSYAVINLSVCNMRAEADFSSEMITQGLMGMPVRVLDYDGWYYIQTPDDYKGWVHNAAVSLMDEAQLHDWNRAEKVVVTAHCGSVYSEPKEKSQTVSDVVAGDRLKYEGKKGKFYRVSYPDGRTGYILKKISVPETKWRSALKQGADDIIRTARTMMGIPYLWAGTSPKGMDCSGFMRTILYMHDIIIPRDASQQALTGERLAIAPDFGNLQPGDFIFFGRKATAEKPERVVHVGMYLGGGRFIHSQGDVRIGSLVATDPLFDEYNLGRMLFAARILPYINKQPGLNTTATNSYYLY
jgi:cell wall-associated NlpC family hydrolase